MDNHAYGKLDIPEMFNMMTPINSTNAFTFGMPRKNVPTVCLPVDQITIKGLEVSGLSLASIFFLQLSMACLLSTMGKYLSKSFSQPPVVGQILAGIIAGPSFLGRSKLFETVMFPFKSLYLLETLSSVSCTLFLFIVGVKMDVDMMRKAGKKEKLIGSISYIFPVLITIPVSSLLSSTLDDEAFDIKSQLNVIAFLHSCTAFHSIMCFLEDQNLLNSELGRLSLSSSMITGYLSYLTLIISMEVMDSLRSSNSGGTFFAICLSGFLLASFTWMVIKPLTLWIIKNTPEGQPMKEIYPLFFLLLALIYSLVGEFLGVHSFYGPMILGVVIPDGTVLAATLCEKFESFISFALLPLYFLLNGIQTNFHMNLKTGLVIFLIAVVGSFTKFLSVMLASVFLCDIPARDAIVIGLIMSSLGFVDVQYFQSAHQLGYVSMKYFGVMNISVAAITTLVSFLVKCLYDPSVRYIAYRRRTIQHALHDVEFRILVCIQDEEQVPNIIKLLEVSNPTRDSPISIYLFYLVELVGRYSPLLIAHENLDTRDNKNPIDRIIKAFRNFQKNKHSSVSLQAFTAIAPFASMHDEICTLALDKRASLVILPFHMLWNDQGTAKETSRFRYVNRKVLKKAPCSVAIFIDHCTIEAPKCTLGMIPLFRVGLFFVGGADDREAIAYAIRMVRHADVVVTVIRCIPKEDNIVEYSEESELDNASIMEFKICNVGCERALLKEQRVANGEEMFRVVRSEEESFDMILVGRRHDKKSPILSGLTDWNEYPELGLLGDLLASKDFKGRASILVVQQHVCTEDEDPKRSRKGRAVLSHQDSFAPITTRMTSPASSLNGSRKWC